MFFILLQLPNSSFGNLIFLINFQFFSLFLSVSSYKLICYFTSWAQYRQGQGRFVAEAIDPHLCSHIIYAFANVKDGQLAAEEWNDASTYENLNNLKSR